MMDTFSNEDILRSYIENIISYGNKTKQLNLLKMYPIFNIKLNIVNIWIKVYQNIYNFKENTIKFKSKNSHSQIKNNTKFEKPKLNFKLIALKENIINFVILGFYFNYINKNCIFKILNIMKKFNEDSKYINSILIYFIQFKNNNNNVIPFMKTNSLKSLKEISYSMKNTDHIESFYLSARALFNNIYESIININNDDFVEEITRQCFMIIKNISTHELIFAGLFDKYSNKKCVNIKHSIDIFEKLAYIIKNESLIKKHKKSQLKKLLIKFITIAYKFYEMRNFHALFAFMAGLNTSSIIRLKNIWLIKEKYLNMFNEMDNFVSTRRNFSVYRSFINNNKNNNMNIGNFPIIPYLGIIISDIKHATESNIIDSKNQKINFNILNGILCIINSFDLFKRYNCNIITNKYILEYLDNILISHDEEIFYNNSIKIYPINSSNNLNNFKKVNSINKIEITNKNEISNQNQKQKKIMDTIHMSLECNTRKKKNKNKPKSKSLRLNKKKNSYINNNLNVNLNDKVSINVNEWTNQIVLEWLTKINMEQYVNCFEKADIIGISLLELKEKHLKNDLGIEKLGHRILIMKYIREFKKGITSFNYL